MKTSKSIFVIFLISLFVAFIFNGCKKSSEGTDKVGAVIVLSGNSAKWGEMARNAIELILNDEDYTGKQESKIKVIYEDSRGEPSKAISGIKKLITVDRVPIIVGDMLSSTTLAMAPIANENKVVLIGISSSSPAVTNAGPYIYRVWPSDLYEGEALASWAISNEIKSVAIIYIKNDYGEGLKDAFQKKFIQVGGSIKSNEYFTDTDKNYRNIITKVLNSNPDAIYIVGYYENTALVVKQIREQNKNVIILGTSSAEHESLINVAGKGAEGFVYPLSSDWDLSNLSPEQEIFRNKFLNKYGEDPDWAAVHGADAILVALETLKHAKTGEQIKAYIDKTQNFNVITGPITFDENGDVINKPIIFKTVKNGKFISIEK